MVARDREESQKAQDWLLLDVSFDAFVQKLLLIGIVLIHFSAPSANSMNLAQCILLRDVEAAFSSQVGLSCMPKVSHLY